MGAAAKMILYIHSKGLNTYIYTIIFIYNNLFPYFLLSIFIF